VIYHICTTCPVEHYDDCPGCFGFGVRVTPGATTHFKAVPIGADESTRADSLHWLPCPVCKSTPAGIPRGRT
jgi:hypothetical protein